MRALAMARVLEKTRRPQIARSKPEAVADLKNALTSELNAQIAAQKEFIAMLDGLLLG